MPASPCTTAASAPSVESTPTKRKRQRRNPVWPYFDVIDGTARCKQCLYSTKSVFSTNLKVHLRSHHRPDYEKVSDFRLDRENSWFSKILNISNSAGDYGGRCIEFKCFIAQWKYVKII